MKLSRQGKNNADNQQMRHAGQNKRGRAKIQQRVDRRVMWFVSHFWCETVPSVAARVKQRKLEFELFQLGVGKLERRHFRRAQDFAQLARFGAETNLPNHVDELAKLDLAIAARIDLFDQLCDLLL